jgi:hypothetical protein
VSYLRKPGGEQTVLAALDPELATRVARLFTERMFLVQVGPACTCDEAEVVADLLRACGLPYAAEMWLYGHSAGDDPIEGDRHVGMVEPDDPNAPDLDGALPEV